jgi:hypothetical protein
MPASRDVLAALDQAPRPLPREGDDLGHELLLRDCVLGVMAASRAVQHDPRQDSREDDVRRVGAGPADRVEVGAGNRRLA